MGRVVGFWECCCLAAFSYFGCEIIAATASEVELQRLTLPKAVRRVAHRLAVYYLGAIFVLGLNLSSNDPILSLSLSDASVFYGSPFALMVTRAGIGGFSHFINAVALIACISVANAALYAAVRPFVCCNFDGRAEFCML